MAIYEKRKRRRGEVEGEGSSLAGEKVEEGSGFEPIKLVYQLELHRVTRGYTRKVRKAAERLVKAEGSSSTAGRLCVVRVELRAPSLCPFTSSLSPVSLPYGSSTVPALLRIEAYPCTISKAARKPSSPQEARPSEKTALPPSPSKKRGRRVLVRPSSSLLLPPSDEREGIVRNSLVDISRGVHSNDLEVEIRVQLLKSVSYDVRLNESELGGSRAEGERFTRSLQNRERSDRYQSRMLASRGV